MYRLIPRFAIIAAAAPLATLGLLFGQANEATAQRIDVNDNHRRSMGNKRPVELFGHMNNSSGKHSGGGHGSHGGGYHSGKHHHKHYKHHGYQKRHRPYYGGAYRYPYPYPYPAYPHGYYPYGYSRYGWSLPPIYLRAEELYGPKAVQRFMGVDHWFNGGRSTQTTPYVVIEKNKPAQPAAVNDGNADGGGPFAAPDAAPAADRPEVSEQAANRAWRFIGFGDAQFTAGNFLEANVRYRKAVAAAPRLGDPYFRQGYALMAAGRWDLAADAIRRGLSHQPDWADSGFTNAELYADNPTMKAEHMRRLAEAAEEDEHDADRLFLLGVMLHFDGKPARAKPFLQRAAQVNPAMEPAVEKFVQ